MEVICINKIIQEINGSLESLEVPVYESDKFELKELAPLLKLLSETKTRVNDLELTVARYAAAKMTAPEVNIDGIALKRSAPSQNTKWDNDSLLSVLLARSRDERQVDEETGEYESEVSAFMRILRECASIGYFKVGKKGDTGLLAHGIDPDEYREKKPAIQKASVLK